MAETQEGQLEQLLTFCRDLGAEVRYCPERHYFTAIVWNSGGRPENERDALSIQRQIQQKAGQLPGVVCYCFDAFSTLVYEV